MIKEYASLDELISTELVNDEDQQTAELIAELQDVKNRRWFNQKELCKMGEWKSHRPKKHYIKNSEEDVISISKKLFDTEAERKKIDILLELKGVSIPTASAILTLIDPENYGVIDIRVWEVLYLYGTVTKQNGKNFSIENWVDYLNRLRNYKEKFKVSARDIERTIFLHHKKIQEGNLYKK